jgi:quercetin dioxygenase-like cupin family protein
LKHLFQLCYAEPVSFIEVGSLPEVQPKDGWRGRFFHSEHMTFAYYSIEAGASLHEHRHPNEEVWHVLEGSLELRVGDESRALAAGDAAVIPAGTPHAVLATAGCRVIVVDHPARHAIAGKRI